MTQPLEFGPAYFAAMKDGNEHRVTEAVYDYFLGVLPPVMLGDISYQGKHWGFGFAEGYDHVTLFRHDQVTGEFFAQQTPWLNPREAGSVESQTKSRILKWLTIGKKNAWISEADDPPFSTQSFHECKTDAELLEKLASANWTNGQAFFVGNLCFIEQGDSNDEWLAIKDGVPFDSISFAHIIKDEGMQAAQRIIDDIRAATVEQCKRLEYGGR